MLHGNLLNIICDQRNKCKLKPQMVYHCTSIRNLKDFFFNVPDAVKVEHLFYFFNVTMPDASKDVEQQELLFITGGNATEKQFSSFTL